MIKHAIRIPINRTFDLKHPIVGAVVATALLSACTTVSESRLRAEMDISLGAIAEHLADRGIMFESMPDKDFSRATADCTHLVLVVDTSGSMRDPATERFHPAIVTSILGILHTFPQLVAVQMVDANGRYLASSGPEWIHRHRTIGNQLAAALHSSVLHSGSTPHVGIHRAITNIVDAQPIEGSRVAILVLTDETTLHQPELYAALVQRRLQTVASERARLRIHVMQFPLVLPFTPYPPVDDLWRFLGPLAQLYDGVYVQLPP